MSGYPWHDGHLDGGVRGTSNPRQPGAFTAPGSPHSAVELRWAELREVGDGRAVAGRAVLYGELADIAGQFREEIRPGAFRTDDVVLNLAHERTALLARTGGGGLEFRDSGTELAFTADLPDTSAARDALALVRSRVVRGASVEMVVTRDEWQENATRRVIHEARMIGLALVARPAYPSSSITAREAALQEGRFATPPGWQSMAF